VKIKLGAAKSAQTKYLDVHLPGTPTREEVLAQHRSDFLSKGNEGVVLDISRSPADVLDLHKKIADRIHSDAHVPPDRTKFFSWIADDQDLRRRGWAGVIMSTTPSEQGTVITIAFRPIIDSIKLGKEISTGDSLTETYTFDGKKLTFIGAEPVYWPVKLLTD